MGPADTRILSLLEAGDVAGAAQLANDAIAAGQSHPLLFDARGHGQLLHGRAEDALADFNRAALLAPRNPALHDAMAHCLILLERFADAIEACDRAIAIAPDFAPAHYDKGCAAEMSGDLVSAKRAYQKAAALDPGLADATARLAALAARKGDWREAAALANRTLATDPGNAIAVLADVTAKLGQGESTGQAMRLEPLLTAGDLPPSMRAQVLGLRADVLDRENRTAEAFADYAAANDTLVKAYAPRFADTPSGTARMARLTKEFDAIPAERWCQTGAGSTSPASGHVFVAGFYRAGTTLLGQILASHPAVVTLEEKPLLIDAATDFLDSPGGLERLASLGEDALNRYRALYWGRVCKLEPDASGRVVVDKLPLNTIAMPVIARLFPDAKFLFAVRDPRDVVFSCFRRLLNVNRDTFEMLSLPRGAEFYASVMDLTQRYRAVLPLAVLDVRNEDVARNFEPSVRAICAFLGLDWKDSMIRFGEQSRQRAIATPSAAQIARGISSDGIGQWRRYAGELASAMPLLAPWVKQYGYETD